LKGDRKNVESGRDDRDKLVRSEVRDRYELVVKGAPVWCAVKSGAEVAKRVRTAKIERFSRLDAANFDLPIGEALGKDRVKVQLDKVQRIAVAIDLEFVVKRVHQSETDLTSTAILEEQFVGRAGRIVATSSDCIS